MMIAPGATMALDKLEGLAAWGLDGGYMVNSMSLWSLYCTSTAAVEFVDPCFRSLVVRSRA